ncbi:MAG: BrnT family toxin [Candidatus Poribacteria bacterium]|nr:BrnT family toxin [Candidatus Poribacteria bacterium]
MTNDITLEWDPEKEKQNINNHNVSFPEASTIFYDNNCITIEDESHSFQEQRYITIGYTNYGRLLTVCATDRGDIIRIISARDATRRERTTYEQQIN